MFDSPNLVTARICCIELRIGMQDIRKHSRHNRILWRVEHYCSYNSDFHDSDKRVYNNIYYTIWLTPFDFYRNISSAHQQHEYRWNISKTTECLWNANTKYLQCSAANVSRCSLYDNHAKQQPNRLIHRMQWFPTGWSVDSFQVVHGIKEFSSILSIF